MRKKRLAKNTVSSIVLQVVTVICGFIVPRLILAHYGSEVNGLVNSVAQFLGVISFLELGLGAVVQSALYRPLAERDDAAVSRIIRSAGRFFRRLAFILLAYVAALIALYPMLSGGGFDAVYTALLIAAMCVSTFAQYYFGIVDQLLLTADQRGYIQCNAQTATLIANTIACAVLIRLNASIQLVKLTTSLIFLLRPIFLRAYVERHYRIDRKIKYEGEPIPQKWNGVAQHVSAVILKGTDTIVLTAFATLEDVSIYAVYNLVTTGVDQLFTAGIRGAHALLGELWARQERKELLETFSWVEWVMHTAVTFVFVCAGLLIVPFVSVYTRNVTDANYIQPLFGVLLVTAFAGHCFRLPYNGMILAAGHYRQTQRCYIIAAAMNIIVSVAAVSRWGLVGVTVGTLLAMAYQTVWMAAYVSGHLLDRPLRPFFLHVAVDVITTSAATAIFMALRPGMASPDYASWILLALKTVGIVAAASLVVNALFFPRRLLRLFNILTGRKPPRHLHVYEPQHLRKR